MRRVIWQLCIVCRAFVAYRGVSISLPTHTHKHHYKAKIVAKFRNDLRAGNDEIFKQRVAYTYKTLITRTMSENMEQRLTRGKDSSLYVPCNKSATKESFIFFCI